MSWTNLQLITKAFSNIGLADYTFDIQPEEFTDALYELVNMMAEWEARGIDLDYTVPLSPDDYDLSADSNLAPYAIKGVHTNLSLRIAPSQGKTVSKDLKTAAKTAFDTIILNQVTISEMSMPGTTPAGQGTKYWADQRDPFLDESAANSSGSSSTGTYFTSAIFTENGQLIQGSGSKSYRLLKNNLTATTAPTTTDDTDAGYSVSSHWFDVSGDKVYICIDDTADAAVWTEITAGAAGGEANTAASAGTGVSVYYQKSGVQLQFNAIKSENALLAVALDATTHDIELTVSQTNINAGVSITASQVSDFDTEVGNNSSVTANTTHAAGSGSDHSDVATNTTHRGLTNNPHSVTAAQASAVALTGNETVAGTKTFSSFPVTPSSAPTSDYEVGNKKYTDDNTTASVIKTRYETNADTNAYTDAEQTKMGYISVTQAVDLDQMETDIAALANGMVYKGDWDASGGSFPGAGSAQTGWFYYVSGAGTVDSVSFAVGDNIVATTDNASTSTYAGNWSKHDQTDAVQSVDGQTGSVDLSSSYQPLDSDLTTIAGLTPGTSVMRGDGAGNWSSGSVGIADNNLVEIDSSSVATGEYAKFTANGLESRTTAEVKTDLSLNNVENTAVSTYLTNLTEDTDPDSDADFVHCYDNSATADRKVKMRNIPKYGNISAETGTTYTLDIEDAQAVVTLNNASAITVTVPPNSSVAFPIGTTIALIQIGAGQVTVAQGSGVTVSSEGSALKLNAQYAIATLIKTGTNQWYLGGSITT